MGEDAGGGWEDLGWHFMDSHNFDGHCVWYYLPFWNGSWSEYNIFCFSPDWKTQHLAKPSSLFPKIIRSRWHVPVQIVGSVLAVLAVIGLLTTLAGPHSRSRRSALVLAQS